MAVLRWILYLSKWLKPFLTLIFPVDFLRRVKKKLVDWGYEKMVGKSRIPYAPEKYADGVNLIGNIRAEIGLGQSCRLLADELEHSKYKFYVFNYPREG
ncbi:MAG: hypothetical protein K2N94_03915, partial [Lachnospiraceae bacterium]|nr:hypothetical protein [Lachnospiraceae bacterium]